MKRYSIIYADPPWAFTTFSAKGAARSADRHYDCMTLTDIQALPIQDITADDAVLFMWATFPMLPQALATIDAWGFTYKSLGFAWTKRNRKSPGWHLGMGYWTRQNTEVCLLATKGKPKRVDAGVSCVLDAPISRHSEKPAETRDRIVRLMGDLPRVELFARTATPGWDVWGNEIDSTLTLTPKEPAA